jgi:hypothetical protein
MKLLRCSITKNPSRFFLQILPKTKAFQEESQIYTW